MTVMESWKKKRPTVRNNNPVERKRKTNGRLLYSFVLLSILCMLFLVILAIVVILSLFF